MKQDQGIGDTIERITDEIGISKIFKSVTKDCGCKRRKEKLNRLFPYKNEINIEEFDEMTPLQRLEKYIKTNE